jgi:ubiquinone/menaquinone biosynthesis C-methylase UbiE
MTTDPIDDALNGTLSGELRRIEEAYVRRHPDSLYTFFNPAYLLTVQERNSKLLRLLADKGYSSLDNTKILEVGCGTGAWLRDFVRLGARPENIWGVDLLPTRIAEARELCPSAITLKCQDATRLEFADGSFDVVLQSTVFTSILNTDVKKLLANEMLRIVRQKGLIVWYDFHVDNPRNLDVQGIGRKEIFRLFPDCDIALQKLTLAPPVGRRVAPISPSLYRLLSGIKPLCTHYLGAITKS